jgi:excisionase family DNA binding protein
MSMPDDHPRRWGSVKEAAAHAHTSTSKIYRLLDEGRLSDLKLDGRRKIDMGELDRLIATPSQGKVVRPRDWHGRFDKHQHR